MFLKKSFINSGSLLPGELSIPLLTSNASQHTEVIALVILLVFKPPARTQNLSE